MVDSLTRCYSETYNEECTSGDAKQGFVHHIASRDLWQLTPDGRKFHSKQLPEIIGDGAEGLRIHYEEFLQLNGRLKEICTAWQIRGGEPNDHTDADYDHACLAELDALHHDSANMLDGFATAVSRFDAYRHRLTRVTARALAGETNLFTGVMCGSFHDIWMELHEDLILLLGIDRRAEGSY